MPSSNPVTAFTVRLAFSEAFPVDADTVRAALAVTGGTMTTVAPADAPNNRDWLITVQPLSASTALTLTLTPTASCTDAAAICTTDSRGIAGAITAEIPGLPASTVTGVAVTSGPGENGRWDTGEAVEAAVRFSRTVAPVVPYGPPPGVRPPVLTILLDGRRREAAYTGGSGSETLTFSYTVTAADNGAQRAWVAPNGLSLNGEILRDVYNRDVGVAFSSTAPPKAFSNHNQVRFWERDYAQGRVTTRAHRAHVPRASQRFRTGSSAAAYRLEGIRITVDLLGSKGGVKVYLYSDNNGLPGRQLTRLEPVGALRDGAMRFRARGVMGEAPLLLPDTFYHILFAVDGNGALLEVAATNDVMIKGGFGLLFGSLSDIRRSLFNEAYWGYCVNYLGDLPPQAVDLFAGENHICENIVGEYGDTYRPKRHEEEAGDHTPLPVNPGFKVTYGWNRMDRQLQVQFIGAAITGEAPLFNLPPRPVSATVPQAGDTLDVVFDNVPDEGAGRTPAAERFAVKADGMDVAISGVVVSASDKRVRLTLVTTIKDDQRVTVSYRDPTDGDDPAALQSPAGVDAPSFANYRVTNGSTVPDPSPKPVSATVPPAGGTVDVIFNHAPDDDSGQTPAAERFTVKADGKAVAVSGVAVSGSDKRVRLTLDTITIKDGQSVTVDYKDPTPGNDTAALQAATGEDAPSFANYPATNNSTVANPAPRPESATLLAAGDTVNVIFTVALNDGTGQTPTADRFTVKADSEAVAIDGIEVFSIDKRVRLALSTAINGEQTVTVSYTDPTPADDTVALQSVGGVDAPSFSDYSVTNNSTVLHPDAVAPVVKSAQFVLDPLDNFISRSEILLTFAHKIDTSSDETLPVSTVSVTADGATQTIQDVGFSVDPNIGAGRRERQVLIQLASAVSSSATSVTLTYTDPTTGDDATAIQSTRGVDSPSFTINVSPPAESSRAPPEPLTAELRDVPQGHGGEAFTFRLVFSEAFPLDAATVQAALAVTGGAITDVAPAAPPDTRNWDITVTPADAATEVTITLAPKASCADAGALCTGDGRSLSTAFLTLVAARVPTHVESVTVTSDPGENGVWDAGETVVVEVRFSRTVSLSHPPQSDPTVGILLDGTRRDAVYEGGRGGTDTLRFEHTVTAADAGAGTVQVVSNSLDMKGVDLGDNEGQFAQTAFDAAPPSDAAPARLSVLRELAENAAPGSAVGAPVVAGDPDNDALTYMLYGEDVAVFTIDAATGQIRTKADVFYDYEIKPEYSVVVVADDGNGNTGSIEVQIRLTDVDEVLSASLAAAPPAHGGAPFTLRLTFSEPVGTAWKTMRDHVVDVTNGRAMRARRVDGDRGLKALTGVNLSAVWELTIEPSGGDVTVALPVTTDCHAEDAVCTRDGRPLSAVASVTVPEGTLPALTAQFSGAPSRHDGSDTFTLELDFTGPVTTTAEDMQSDALQVTNGRVTAAAAKLGRRDRWLITVEPTALQDVSVALAATASCEDAGAVCAPDGRKLSSGAEVSVTGPASIPLRVTRQNYHPVHDRSVFELKVDFSWPVTIKHKAMAAHGLKVTNGEVIKAFRQQNTDGKTWVFRVRPWSNDTVTVTLPVTADCASAGAVCTEDGRTLSNALVWEIPPDDLEAVDETAPELQQAEADAASLVLVYSEGLDEDSTPEATAFAVTVAGATRTLAANDPVTVSGRRVMLTLAPPVAYGETATVSYTAPSSDPVQDVSGNEAPAFSAQTVDNHTPEPDTTAPVLQGAAASLEAVVLTYDEALDEASTPEAGAFAVTLAGETLDLAATDAVVVRGSTVTLTLAAAAAHGATLAVRYTVPSDNPLQDVSGNPALAAAVEAAVPAAPPEEEPATFTVWFEEGSLPAAHDGTNPIVFRIVFSEELASHVDQWTLRTHAMMIRLGGRRIHPSRAVMLESESGERWEIEVPHMPSYADKAKQAFTIEIEPTEDCAAEVALCTDDGKKLSNRLFATIKGPPALSVTDAQVAEAAEATVALTVSLSREATATVTVDYATADDTATAGEDYTDTSGTLTFEAGETAKTVSVAVLDDAASEGPETFTLTLSNASGAGAYLKAASATGTIKDDEAETSATAPRVTGVELVADSSGDRIWTTDETIEVRLTFNEAVTVADGTPQVGVTIDGVAATLDYASGSGNATLVFSRAVTDSDGSLSRIGVSADSLALNGASIVSPASTLAAELDHDGTEPTAPGTALSTRSTENTDALTVAFLGLPTSHDGSPFTFELRFSEAFPISYLTLRDRAFTVTNGHVTGARRLDNPHHEANGMEPNRVWEITVQPDTGAEDVSIILPATTDCAASGAVCTEDDRPLSVGGAVFIGADEEDEPAVEPTPNATGAPAITGTAQVGETLTAAKGNIADTDGLSKADNSETGYAYRYQWVRVDGTSDTGITGATSNAYTLAAADEGKKLKVRASFQDDAGTDEARTSAATGTVAPVPPPPPPPPLTAAFSDVPPAHDGSTAFVMHFRLSEEPHDLSYVTVRESVFDVTGGRIERAKRLTQGSNQGWALRVAPSGDGDVTVRVKDTTSCTSGPKLCSEDGRRLAGGLQVSIEGPPPPALSVADATVQEGAGATLAFAVTLDRTPTAALTVDYATADGTGTSAANAGTDYTATSGTLTFAVGESSKTIPVAVLDDSHDEGEETMSLTLSNPSGASIADATATGTINNTDAMPKGWLSRFGRTSAAQVAGLLDSRFDEAPASSAQLTLGGRSVPLAALRAGPAGPDRAASAPPPVHCASGADCAPRESDRLAADAAETDPFDRLNAAYLTSSGSAARSGAAAGAAVEQGTELNSVPGQAGGANATLLERAAWNLLTGQNVWQVDRRQFLSRSSFELSLTDLSDLGTDFKSVPGKSVPGQVGEDESVETVTAPPAPAGHWSLWGRGALTRFAGMDSGVNVDGDVLTGLLGLDYARDRWLTGVGLSWSDGAGSYRAANGGGELDSTLLSVHPYLRYALTERVSVWGVLGYGQGAMTLTPAIAGDAGDGLKSVPGEVIETDLRMGMGALGVRGTVYASATTELALKSDVLWVSATSAAADGLAATTGETSRVRLLLTGNHRRDLGAGRALAPSVELGLRYDAGDAERGAGVEAGGGLRYVDPRLGLTVETRARALLAHEDSGYEEWGLGGSMQLDPGRLGRGLALRLDSSWGATDSGTEALWQRQDSAGLARQHGALPGGRIRAEWGYGLDVPWTNAMLTPYSSIELAGGGSRSLHLGWRYTLGQSLSLSFGGERRETAHAPPEYGLMLRTTLPW